MKDLFIPYKESLILKELGFTEECFGHYFKDGRLNHPLNFDLTTDINQYEVNATLFQQAAEFLWEKYKIFIDVYIEESEIYCQMFQNNEMIGAVDYSLNSPITAWQSGIIKAINYLKEREEKQ